jgi:lipid-A-disaccharide synthase
MRVLLVAGEASGDAHAAKVARLLLERGASISAVVGERLRRLPVRPLADVDDLSVVGVSEVLRRLPRILRVRRRLEQEIRSGRYDLLLTVDYPGLNLRLARTAHRHGVPVLHYIGPQVWAWRAHRLRTLRECVDHVALVLPFEEPMYRSAGVRASFVGHPLLEDTYETVAPEADLALFPGSRRQEIDHHLPTLLQTAAAYRQRHADLELRVSLAAPGMRDEVARRIDAAGFDADSSLVDEPAGQLMCRSRASLVASGTATLEAALAGKPFAVFYRTSALTFAIARRLVKVRHVALANLVAEHPFVREYLQADFRVDTLLEEVERLLLDDAERHRIATACAAVRQRLGEPGASARVARLAEDLVHGHPTTHSAVAP